MTLSDTCRASSSAATPLAKTASLACCGRSLLMETSRSLSARRAAWSRMCDEGEQATCRRTLRCSDEGGGCTQMQDQSVYHSVTAQLTIQPSSSAVPSSVLLLAQTSLLRRKGTVNQETTKMKRMSART